MDYISSRTQNLAVAICGITHTHTHTRACMRTHTHTEKHRTRCSMSGACSVDGESIRVYIHHQLNDSICCTVDGAWLDCTSPTKINYPICTPCLGQLSTTLTSFHNKWWTITAKFSDMIASMLSAIGPLNQISLCKLQPKHYWCFGFLLYTHSHETEHAELH